MPTYKSLILTKFLCIVAVGIQFIRGHSFPIHTMGTVGQDPKGGWGGGGEEDKFG